MDFFFISNLNDFSFGSLREHGISIYSLALILRKHFALQGLKFYSAAIRREAYIVRLDFRHFRKQSSHVRWC